jgi:integrase/recombinase XerD
MNSLKKFEHRLKVTDLSKETLLSYERHLINSGLSPSTVGIYMRQLRCIVNKAISQGLLKQEKYPFKGYNIPVSRNIKKALKEEQIKQLLNYRCRLF